MNPAAAGAGAAALKAIFSPTTAPAPSVNMKADSPKSAVLPGRSLRRPVSYTRIRYQRNSPYGPETKPNIHARMLDLCIHLRARRHAEKRLKPVFT
jgi:hypothetical protein